MASAYTTKLQLNQWAAGDKFLREEFNRDNQRIEAACVELYGMGDRLGGRIDQETGALRQQLLEKTGALDGRITAETADIRRQLDPASYHIYNLMLQNDYDGRYTGYKKAMVFDGFQDGAQVAEVVPGAHLDTAGKQVRILTQGAQNIDTGFVREAGWEGNSGHDANVSSWVGVGSVYTADVPIQPSGFGLLQSVVMRMASFSVNDTIQTSLTLLSGEQVIATAQPVSVVGSTFRDYTFVFPGGVSLLGLQTYTLRVTNVSRTYYLKVLYQKTGNRLGYTCTFTPVGHTTGSVRTVPFAVGTGYTRVMAWARHTGSLGITLNAGSTAQPLAQVSTRPARTLDGESCTETAYQLGGAAVSADGCINLTLSLNAAGGSAILYDYGVIFI